MEGTGSRLDRLLRGTAIPAGVEGTSPPSDLSSWLYIRAEER